VKNPFSYPSGFEWLVVLANSPPGTMMWVPLIDARTGEHHIGFALREESAIIEGLPSTKAGTAIIEWRLGVLGLETSKGKTVAFLDVMIQTPGGIFETNINVLHLDETMIDTITAEKPIIMLFVGDSGRVERQVMFPNAAPLREVVEKALKVFETDPWTDKDYDAVKKHFEQTSTLEEIWNLLRRR
jgi:hypothetical protein